MSATSDEKPGVVSVATSGIQDVSALLPLLGTEQCERHVTLALQDGMLYAAATPISIFGSLGIVKAGFVVFWGTIHHQFFPGPKLLRNAGFTPSGIGQLLVPVAGDKHPLYVAEDKIRRQLAKAKIRWVEVDLLSADFWVWNARLIGLTASLSAFGILPYIYLIVRFLPDEPFQRTWLYPCMRIIGCDLVVIAIQVTFQLRVLEEVYHRIRFIGTDTCLKEQGRPPSAPFWDHNERSKDVLDHVQRGMVPNSTKRFTFDEENFTSSDAEWDFTDGLGKMASVSFGSAWASPPVYLNLDRYFSTLLLWMAQASLLFGLGLATVGYIGCFSVVQASPRDSSRGPLIWLVCEAVLAICRTLLWAWNPTWDDAPSPIALEKITVRSVDEDVPPSAGTHTDTSFGVGWTLDSLTTNDMHALVIGIDEFQGPFEKLSKSVSSARSIATYLQGGLSVPRSQIITLTNHQATKARILEELKALSQRETVVTDTPILIYIATHVINNSFIVPYLEENAFPESGDVDLETIKRNTLSYRSFSALLKQIAEEKTDNITLILESACSPQYGRRPLVGPWEKVEPGHTEGLITTGPSPHILLVASASDEEAGTGGFFTQVLLEVLTTYSLGLRTMTYGELVNSINGQLHMEREEGPGAACTTQYRNHLLFKGLFSRKRNENSSKAVITVRYEDL